MVAPGSGGSAMWIMVAIVVVIVALAVIFAIRAAMAAAGGASPRDETPLEILEKRYARGEITKEEFEQMKRDLGLY